MSFYSQFVKNISFPLLNKYIGRPNVSQEIEKLEKSQYWSRNKIENLQINKLRDLLVHAYQTTGYYKKLFDECSFQPASFSSLEDIKKIPLLTKNIIRENTQDFLSNKYSEEQIHFSETGGTTGVKMKFWRDNECLSQKEASRYRFECWTGWNIGDRMGLVWPAQQDYVGYWTKKAKIQNELFERQIVLPAAILEDKAIEEYLKELQKKRPTMIRAFPSPIYQVAMYAVQTGHRVDSIKGIVTTGEPLYKHQRQTIEKAFGCKVFDSYRSREAGPLAQECEKHNGLHINSESLYVEVVPMDNAEEFDEGMGEIVITDLLNWGMPLIRYKMGDIGIISKRQCDCGRGLPLLENVTGRSGDNLLSSDGRKIMGGSLVLYLVDEAPGLIGQTQVIQDKIDHLLIRMTDDPLPTDEIKTYQKRIIRDLFGPEMKVTFEIVSEIPNSQSGKYLFTKCMLEQE